MDLRNLIKERCGTARRFAEEVGLSESTVSKILNRKRRLYVWHVKKFAEVLGVSDGFLMSIVEVENDDKRGGYHPRFKSEDDS